MPKHTHDIPLRVVQYELLQNQFLRLTGVNRGTEESFLDSSVALKYRDRGIEPRNRGIEKVRSGPDHLHKGKVKIFLKET